MLLIALGHLTCKTPHSNISQRVWPKNITRVLKCDELTHMNTSLPSGIKVVRYGQYIKNRKSINATITYSEQLN